MILDDIKQIILNDNPNYNVFMGFMPASPADCITLYLTSGYGNDFDLDGTKKRINQGVQAIIRASNPLMAFTMAENFDSCLDGKAQTINGTHYYKIFKEGGTINLGRDEQGQNTLISCNYTVSYEKGVN